MDTETFARPSARYRLDREQGRVRIGLLVLTNDYVVERDMMAMRPDDDEVHLFVARVPFEGECEPEALAAMAGRLTASTDSILPGGRLDSVIYSCTSGTAAIGAANVARSIRASRPHAAVVTPITAAHEAFEALGMERVSVLTPYTDEVTSGTVAALEAGGAEAVATMCLGIEVSDDISAVTPDSIRDAAIEADHPAADGLFISCTDFRAVQMIEDIEARVGKPVVTANQATFWSAIRKGGYESRVDGFGQLLRMQGSTNLDMTQGRTKMER